MRIRSAIILGFIGMAMARANASSCTNTGDGLPASIKDEIRTLILERVSPHWPMEKQERLLYPERVLPPVDPDAPVVVTTMLCSNPREELPKRAIRSALAGPNWG